jgi:hypothetical protein
MRWILPTLLLATASPATALDTLAVGEVTYRNVTVKNEYPSSFFIQHDGGNAFIKRSDLTTHQVAALSTHAAAAAAETAQGADNILQTKGERSETFQAIIANVATPVGKKPKGGTYTGRDIAAGKAAYPGWTTDEILRHHMASIKRMRKKTAPGLRYSGWMEVLAEAESSLKDLPEAVSNRETWHSKGLPVRNQTAANCIFYAYATVLDAVLINRGVDSPRLSASWIEKNCDPSFPNSGDIHKLILRSPFVGANKQTYDLSKVTFRTCRGFSLGLGKYTEFPSWLMRKVWKEQELHPEELVTINTDLMKHEIAKGRPVVLGCPFPGVKDFDKIYKQDGNTEIVMRKDDFEDAKFALHGVVVTGYKPDPKNPHGVLFEFINSWGPRWGNNGSAWISDCYLEAWGADAYSVSEI